MKLSKKIIPSAIAASLILSFSACGGGGSSTPTAGALSTVTASGTAVDGYIQGGIACLDLNLDNACDTRTEPYASTDSAGKFSLSVTAAHQTHANYDTAGIVVIGGIDSDTNKAFIGTMTAPYNASSSIVVSPITTMVQAIIKSGKTEAEAKAAVAGALGLNADDVLKDPVAEFNAGNTGLAKAALTVQKSVEVLAKANVTQSTTNTSDEDEFETIYAQLANSAVAISEDAAATKSFAAVVEKAKTDGDLKDGAAASSAVVRVIETEIENDVSDDLTNIALVADSKTADIKKVVIVEVENDREISETEVQSASDAAQDNPRIIQIEDYLEDAKATGAQITTVMALQSIIDLAVLTNTTPILKDNIATLIANSFDDTIADLAIALGQTPKVDLSGDITTNMTLTKDKVWVLNGLVAVTSGATLTIEPGTTIIGKAGTGANTSYMIIDKGSKINAAGTMAEPIIFMGETAYDGGANEWGQWGGLTIIGNAGNSQVAPYEVNTAYVAGTSDLADNSGVLTYVSILNSGITMEQNKEINGLSMVGVGSGTTVENITVNKSDDDCVEIWGGTVNLTNVDVSECSDDHFDIDDGYAGTVTNLKVTQTTGYSGIEMSGTTAATFTDFNINVTSSIKDGAIYFKKGGIGGHFNNGTIVYNTPDLGYGALHSSTGYAIDTTTTSFSNVTISGSNTTQFSGPSAAALQTVFENQPLLIKADLSGDITTNMTLTKDKVWVLNGLVAVTSGATLTIEPGTTIIGKAGTGANTSYMIIDKGSKINAAGTMAEPIIFMGETAYDGGANEWGQWGGLTIIGNAGNSQVAPYEVNTAYVAGTSDLADNSGVLTYVSILNSGITMEQNKEINGLSMVGVGSGTTVENITVNKSDDDCVEIWGGTVNLTNVDVSECSDDHFDIDDGYAGTVTNLKVTQTTGYSGIEMSGTTAATFTDFNINVTSSIKDGAIYFKKGGIGGHFNNGTIVYNTPDLGYGALHSSTGYAIDTTTTSFSNVTISGSNTTQFSGPSAAALQTVFDANSTNVR